jgi:hypothetical protein
LKPWVHMTFAAGSAKSSLIGHRARHDGLER